MRDNDGRKLDHQWLEALRVRAVRRIKHGAPAAEACAIVMRKSTGYRWLATYGEGGEEALKAKPVPGRPLKLTSPQIARVGVHVDGSARICGSCSSTSRWTGR